MTKQRSDTSRLPDELFDQILGSYEKIGDPTGQVGLLVTTRCTHPGTRAPDVLDPTVSCWTAPTATTAA